MRNPRQVGALTEETIERFWRQVDRNGPIPSHVLGLGQCWIRSGGLLISVKGRSHSIAKVGWVIQNGPIPPNLYVLHRCDNPHCVRSDHLWLGTASDNSKDMAVKGRGSTGRPRKE